MLKPAILARSTVGYGQQLYEGSKEFQGNSAAYDFLKKVGDELVYSNV
jgi:hypothetical protein